MRYKCNACGNKGTNFFQVVRVSLMIPTEDMGLLEVEEVTKLKANIGPIEVPMDNSKCHVNTDDTEELTVMCAICLSEDID